MHFGLTTEKLLDLFNNKIKEIIGQVKLRLYDDAKDENLFVTELKVVEKPSTTPTELAKQKAYTIKVCDYREKSAKFDEILSAVGDYFDLFRQNTQRLEDLWL